MSVSDFPNWSQVCPADSTRRHRNIDPTFVSENSKWNISLFPYSSVFPYSVFKVPSFPYSQLLLSAIVTPAKNKLFRRCKN